MSSSSALRKEIEAKLASRIPSALSPAARRASDLLRCHDEGLNALLGGGVPIAAISEVYGAESSGRTTLAMSVLSAATCSGSVAAWIDVSDSLDPETAARSGVDLQRLLWVRCNAGASAESSSHARESQNSSAQAGPEQGRSRPVGNGGCGSPHPRSEGRGMAEAIHALLDAQPRSAAQHGRRQSRVIGTPGAPNRSVMSFPHASPYREEQTPTDRLPARRGGSPQNAIKDAKAPAQPRTWPSVAAAADCKPALRGAVRWAALDHALRVTDLLLQSGGFALLVLDLGSAPAEMASRIPAATWFRFRAACERSRSTLLVLSQHACAKSSADRTVHMQPGSWTVQGNRTVTGAIFAGELKKERHAPAHTEKVISFLRKPPQADGSSTWCVQAPWAGTA